MDKTDIRQKVVYGLLKEITQLLGGKCFKCSISLEILPFHMNENGIVILECPNCQIERVLGIGEI